MAKTYIARRKLKIGDGYRMPGELVPEAAGWRNIRSLLRLQWIEEIDADDAELTVEAHAASESARGDLSALTRVALIEKAKAAGHTGLSRLNKSELVALLAA